MDNPELSRLAQKTSVRFAKAGPAIYHSHHDMIRFWERAVKRAGLPMRLTQGFNPRPRIIFPHALGLGISSRCEEVELELHHPVPLPDLLAGLVDACGDTLGILDAQDLPPVKKSRQLVTTSYAISGWEADVAAGLPGIAAGVLAMDEIIVERGAPGEKRTLDIRPFLLALDFDQAERRLLLELRHSQSGSARPDEIAKLVAAGAGTDWRDLRIEKTAMVLE
jgi:radical SAM-linked protein